MADPYKILGVGRDASQEDIRKAYRKLAKETHPDLNPGNTEAERRFKDISMAYDLLGDPEKRKRFDAGEIDETGAERPERRFYRDYAEADPNVRYSWRTSSRGGGPWETFDTDDIFADLFGGAGGARFRARPPRRDASYTLPINFLDAVKGGRKTVSMPDGKTLDISIPPGIRDGQMLRLKGQGHAGAPGEAPGDAYVTVQVLPHEHFTREGYDIHSELPITLGEALNGAVVRAETVDGPVDVKIPKGTKNGAVLRLRNKGVLRDKAGARGDHLIKLTIVPPQNPDEELARFMADWEAKHPQSIRQNRRGQA